MRPTFGREYIENEFQRITEGLSDPFTVYLIGGGAMSFITIGLRASGSYERRRVHRRDGREGERRGRRCVRQILLIADAVFGPIRMQIGIVDIL